MQAHWMPKLECPVINNAEDENKGDERRVDHDAVLIGLFPCAIARIKPKYLRHNIGKEPVLWQFHAGEQETEHRENEEATLHESVEYRMRLFWHTKIVACCLYAHLDSNQDRPDISRLL